MQARLSAVQQALLVLPVASLVLAVVALPHPENRRYMAALDEVEGFHKSFDRAALERSLADAAEAQGMLPLAEIQRAAGGKQVPALKLAGQEAALRPFSSVSLATLADVHAHAREQSALTIGTPDGRAIGGALAWRLADSGKQGPFVLEKAELVRATVSAEDVALEQEVAKLRLELLRAQAAVEQAQRRLEQEDKVLEFRRKRRLPWKVLSKSIESRKEAADALAEKTREQGNVEQRYREAATQARAARPAAQGSAVPERAVVRLGLSQAGEQSTLDIPVALEVRSVPVPSLRGGAFAAAQAAGLWDEIAGQDSARAIDAIRAHFNWHKRELKVLGVPIGGTAVLQLLPCLLPLLLWLALARIRAASFSYSPFSSPVTGALPRVGLKSRLLDCVALVLLPLAACASAATALFIVAQPPVLPVLAAIACLLIGSMAYAKLGDLQALVVNVRHSQSYPPPPEPRLGEQLGE